LIVQVLHSVTSAALRALPQEALQDMDKALQLNSINVSKWQAAMIVIQGWCSLHASLAPPQFYRLSCSSEFRYRARASLHVSPQLHATVLKTA
jgi:hypothetical protein